MILLLLAFLALTSVMASDHQMCTKFLKENTYEIGLYHKHLETRLGIEDKILLYKRGLTVIYEMTIGSDDHKNVWLRFKAKSNDVIDVHKFDLVLENQVWNCSSKKVNKSQ